jgi:hypothetical protein
MNEPSTKTSEEIEQTVRNTVRNIMEHGGGIVTGGRRRYC